MANESVQQLFSKYTVVEIRELGKKTRQEIETKKEELRQMVGERYRDLIETADTIAVMKKCASSLKGSVCSLQKYTANELKNDQPKQQKLSNNLQTGSAVDSYLNLSAQVKLLMEVSETIWSHVERGNMIEATHLYMQSRQVLKNLRLDGSTTYCPILQWFPVLGQQAQALDNLRTTILSECRQLLKDDQLNSKTISEAMCSIILLENTDISSVFTEFMDARFSAINAKFDLLHEVGTSKLCKVVMLLAATLKQANLLFVSSVDCKVSSDAEKTLMKNSKNTQESDIGLVQHSLKKSYELFSEKCAGFEKAGATFEEKCWSKHLPDSVSKLSSMDISNQNTSSAKATQIQTTCSQWLEKCKQSITNGAKELLTYINTFKALATMRQSLWDTLEEVSDIQRTASHDQWKIESLEQGDTKHTEWEEACLSTLGRRLSLWDEILKTLFLNKVKSLSEKSFSNLLTNGKQKLNDTLQGLEAINKTLESTNQFIWRELPSDIPQDTAWKQVSVKKGKEVKGGLGLKALTVTPTLHNMCLQLNSSMRQVLNDLSHYIPNIDVSGTNNEKKPSNEEKLPLVSKEERLKITSDFEQACVHCLREFLNILKEHQELLTQKLTTEKNCADEILFLAMFCRNFCQLCDEFHTGCVIGTNTSEAPIKRQLSSSMTESMMLRSTQPDVSPLWEEIGKDMSAQSNRFLELWFKATVNKAVLNFKVSFLNLKSAIDFFETMPAWDHVKIQEESESGSKVESEIKLPMTVSWSVQELLYFVCNDISRVGGHSMSRSTLQDIALLLLKEILQTFIDLKEAVTTMNNDSTGNTDVSGNSTFIVTQSWALQKLYDLRTLHGLLHVPQQQKSEENKSIDEKYSDLVDWLESYIDPFDLDVFAPHLTKNVQKSIHCSSVMLGFITPSDKSDSMQSLHSISKSGGSSHNILPLTADLGRFSYLPISSRMSKPDTVNLPASVKNHLPLSSAMKQLTDADKKMEGGRKQSLYSKLGALGSSWLSMATSEN